MLSQCGSVIGSGQRGSQLASGSSVVFRSLGLTGGHDGYSRALGGRAVGGQVRTARTECEPLARVSTKIGISTVVWADSVGTHSDTFVYCPPVSLQEMHVDVDC